MSTSVWMKLVANNLSSRAHEVSNPESFPLCPFWITNISSFARSWFFCVNMKNGTTLYNHLLECIRWVKLVELCRWVCKNCKGTYISNPIICLLIVYPVHFQIICSVKALSRTSSVSDRHFNYPGMRWRREKMPILCWCFFFLDYSEKPCGAEQKRGVSWGIQTRLSVIPVQDLRNSSV